MWRASARFTVARGGARRTGDRLSHAGPASKTLLIRAAERGSNLGSITGAMLRLLDRYGAAELRRSIATCLTPAPSASPSSGDAMSASSCRPSPPICPTMSRRATLPSDRPGLELYDQPSDE